MLNIAAVAFVVMVIAGVVAVGAWIWDVFDKADYGGSGWVTRSEPALADEKCEALRMMILDSENADATDDAITYEEHC